MLFDRRDGGLAFVCSLAWSVMQHQANGEEEGDTPFPIDDEISSPSPRQTQTPNNGPGISKMVELHGAEVAHHRSEQDVCVAGERDKGEWQGKKSLLTFIPCSR